MVTKFVNHYPELEYAKFGLLGGDNDKLSIVSGVTHLQFRMRSENIHRNCTRFQIKPDGAVTMLNGEEPDIYFLWVKELVHGEYLTLPKYRRWFFGVNQKEKFNTFHEEYAKKIMKWIFAALQKQDILNNFRGSLSADGEYIVLERYDDKRIRGNLDINLYINLSV